MRRCRSNPDRISLKFRKRRGGAVQDSHQIERHRDSQQIFFVHEFPSGLTVRKVIVHVKEFYRGETGEVRDGDIKGASNRRASKRSRLSEAETDRASGGGRIVLTCSSSASQVGLGRRRETLEDLVEGTHSSV